MLTSAVIYARVSSREQERDGFSIPAQLKLLRDYATKEELQVEREFVDVETARRAGRAAFGEMVSFLGEHPGCRALLVEKTDRLYRNIKDWVTLDELAVEIHFVKEGAVLSSDSRSTQKFLHGIKVLMAKNYVDNLSEETSKGMTEKARQGIWPSYAPLGYRNALRSDGKRVIELDPEVAPLIVSLFERYATGRHSVAEVARLAREDGLSYRKSGTGVSKATAHRVLRSRIYTGDFVWAGTLYPGIHEPLVTLELWEKVQAVMDGRAAKKHRRAKHDFAFARLIECGHCGCALVGEIKKGKYVYYHCTGYRGRCPEPYVRQEVLEDHFARILGRLRFDADVLAWIRDALRESHADKSRYHDAAVRRLQGQHARLQTRINAMYIDKLDGVIEPAFFEEKSTEWRREQSDLLRRIEIHQTADQHYLEEGAQLLDLANQAADLFAEQPAREKRRLLDFVLSNCSWKGGELTPEFRQPFDLLVVANTTEREQVAAGAADSDRFEKWLPDQDSNLEQTG